VYTVDASNRPNAAKAYKTSFSLICLNRVVGENTSDSAYAENNRKVSKCKAVREG
jgi:hypothetical protein